MQKLIFFFVILLSTTLSAQQKNFHSFKVTDIDGQVVDLSVMKGKKVMVVNTASRCGLTSQYEKLEALYKQHGGEKFVIIGFPANNFMSQEPGTDAEIREFCTKNYGVSFPMMSKISVKGEDMHPLYRWLTQKSENGMADSEVKWNFQKYLIDENGKLVEVIPPRESPDSEKIISWITGK